MRDVCQHQVCILPLSPRPHIVAPGSPDIETHLNFLDCLTFWNLWNFKTSIHNFATPTFIAHLLNLPIQYFFLNIKPPHTQLRGFKSPSSHLVLLS